MELLYTIAKFALFLWVVKDTFFWVALWQLKEYRLDRLLIHLTETRQGRDILFSPFSLLKWLVVFGYGYVAFSENAGQLYQYIVFAVLIFEAFIVCRDLLFNRLVYPRFTFKAELIVLFIFLLVFLLSLIPLVDRMLWLLLIDRGIVFWVGAIVLTLSFPTELYRDFQISRARKKIKKNDVFVIAIVGSYGKSSTKECIAQVLEKKFSVLKTQGSHNSPIGIAQTILKRLKDDTHYFVVEIGSYKTGEIREISHYLQPQIGVITSVNEQHLSFFENEKVAAQSKYELIESLPKKGIALFNGNNPITVSFYKQTRKKKVLYAREIHTTETLHKKIKYPTPDIQATNIAVHKKHVSFDVRIYEKTIHFTSPLLGAHNIENILPAIYIANYVGMKEKEIKQAVSKLTPMPKTMGYIEYKNGATFVDDSLNTNPTAVYAALSYMQIFTKKKIFVLQPMIELGKKAEEEHFKIGREIGKVCDYLYVTDKNYYRSLVQGVNESGGKCIVLTGGVEKIERFIEQTVKKDDVVIFEGKEAGRVLNRLID